MAQAEVFEEDIIDFDEEDEPAGIVSYDVTSYGSDPDVEGLVRRLDRGDIVIPSFQRSYVWSKSQASRFIESLLLGLPVPGIFLAVDAETEKQIVIDGQQRLRSLQMFYQGLYSSAGRLGEGTPFKLVRVQRPFEGLTYNELNERDRIRLDTSIIHATVVRQLQPENDDGSIYHIFERLNSGGSKLSAQEIRTALYHGPFMDLISNLNDNEAWRFVFGDKHKRLKDQELILRFIALFEESDKYARPMGDFLNGFSLSNRFADEETQKGYADLFISTIEGLSAAIGKKLFRLDKTLNAAVFDSCMVGYARAIACGVVLSADEIVERYDSLISSREYLDAVSRSTADDKQVKTRLGLATQAFGGKQA